MTETEYQGYKRNHRSIEHAVDREELKTKDRQADSIRQRKKAKRKMDFTLRRGSFCGVEDIRYESQKAERYVRGPRGRNKKRKLIEGYEENSENTGFHKRME